MKKPDEGFNKKEVTRRALLVGVAGGGVYLGISKLIRALTASTYEETPNVEPKVETDRKHVADFEGRFFDVINDMTEGRVEKRELQLVPEWERKGSDMFINMLSEDLGYNSHLERIWSGILDAFPDGTTIHIMTFTGGESELLGDLETIYPHLKFQVYGYDSQRFDSMVYAQDMLFATGKKTASGQFKIFTASMDDYFPEDDTWSFLALKGDDELTKKYPDTFKSESIPSRLEGGDMQVTIRPDGTSAIIVGDNNFRILVGGLIIGANYNNRGSRNGNFDYAYRGAAALLAQYFGVDDVIITDERDILSRLEGKTLESFIKKREDFYHVDMILRTAVCPNGSHVTFFTRPDPFKTKVGREDLAYIERIERQFVDMGYEIEPLPCGPYPSLNYTNVLMFTPEGSVPTVMVPFYGLESDKVAAAAYEKRGFKVIPVDMSYILNLSAEDQEEIGSLHCLVEVML